MRKLLTILSFTVCQTAFCQTNSYTAYWKVKPNSNVTSFTIQRSSDNTNWVNAIVVAASSDTSYKANFNAYANNFIRVQAKTKDTTWSSPIIQVVSTLPIKIRGAFFKHIKVRN